MQWTGNVGNATSRVGRPSALRPRQRLLRFDSLRARYGSLLAARFRDERAGPTLWGLASLGDLPDLDRLEDAGLLGKAPLPEELRGALGITGDDEDEDRAASAADDDDDGEADGDYAGLRWAEE